MHEVSDNEIAELKESQIGLIKSIRLLGTNDTVSGTGLKRDIYDVFPLRYFFLKT